MTGYIEDGYNLTGYVAGSAASSTGQRVYDGLEFVYRPAMRAELARHDAQVRIALKNDDTDPEAAVKSEELATEFVAKHLLSWDLKDSKGADVPLTTAALSRLQMSLFNSVYRIVRGIMGSDPKPDATVPASDDKQLGN